jgi:hypothetical protein
VLRCRARIYARPRAVRESTRTGAHAGRTDLPSAAGWAANAGARQTLPLLATLRAGASVAACAAVRRVAARIHAAVRARQRTGHAHALPVHARARVAASMATHAAVRRVQPRIGAHAGAGELIRGAAASGGAGWAAPTGGEQPVAGTSIRDGTWGAAGQCGETRPEQTAQGRVSMGESASDSAGCERTSEWQNCDPGVLHYVELVTSAYLLTVPAAGQVGHKNGVPTRSRRLEAPPKGVKRRKPTRGITGEKPVFPGHAHEASRERGLRRQSREWTSVNWGALA